MITQDVLWVEKYRPQTIDEIILPKRIKKDLQEIVKKGDLSLNLLFTGPAGIGKTTAAKAICNELGADNLVINGSLDGNIDTLRNEIMQFASSVSFAGGRKIVILDEADYLNPNSTQPSLRNFMESFSHNCGFILTCNFIYRIIEPLHGRCSVVDFTLTKTERVELGAQFFKRIQQILTKEGIAFDPKVVVQLIKPHLADWRRCINEIQRQSLSGVIDASSLAGKLEDVVIDELISHMKEKAFSDVRRWIAENSDLDTTTLFRKMYNQASSRLENSSIPPFIMLLSQYQFQSAFVADPEINLAAFCAEAMKQCQFK